jgi:hypothetical protein
MTKIVKQCFSGEYVLIEVWYKCTINQKISKQTSRGLRKMASGDIAWIITATALVMLMTPALGFFYGGLVRKKNLVSTIVQ